MGNVFSPSFEARKQSLNKRREELNARENKLRINKEKYKANTASLATNIKQYVQKKEGEIGPASQKIAQHTKLLGRLNRGSRGGNIGRGGYTYDNLSGRLGGRRGYQE